MLDAQLISCLKPRVFILSITVNTTKLAINCAGLYGQTIYGIDSHMDWNYITVGYWTAYHVLLNFNIIWFKSKY